MKKKYNYKVQINDIETYFKYFKDIVLLDRLTHHELVKVAYSLNENRKEIIKYFGGYPVLINKNELVLHITRYYYEYMVVGSE